MTTISTTTSAANAPPVWSTRSFRLALVIVLLFVGSILRIANLDGVVTRTPDERNYTWEAAVLLHEGTSGIQTLADAIAKDPLIIPPTRAGYLFTLATAMRLTGNETPDTGAELSCIASIVSLLLVAMLAWRFFSPESAIAAVAMLAVSPLALMTSRRGWEEAFVEALTLALLWLAFEIASDQRHLAWLAAFALLGGFAITVKEVTTIGFALCALAVLAILIKRRDLRSAGILAGLCAVSSMLAYGWLAWMLGGIAPLLASLHQTAHVLDASGYSILNESGSPWQLLQAFLKTAPLATLLAVGAAINAAWPRKPFATASLKTLALAAYAAVFIVLVLVEPHHLNLRYLCPIYAPLYLLAGVGLAKLLSFAEQQAPESAIPIQAGALVLLAAFAIRDDSTFRRDFAVPDLQDLSLRMVLTGTFQLPAPPPAPDDSTTLKTLAQTHPSAESWLNISAAYARSGQQQLSIDAARKCLELDPSNALAWNNIAADYEDLHQWDQAIGAANHALQIDPDFQLAKNNLNWSLSQKRLKPSN